MNNYCAFSKNNKCLKWLDHEMTRHELEEADILCHENWIEIRRKSEYIQMLQAILEQNGIGYPEEL